MQSLFPDVMQPYVPLIKSVAMAILIFIVGWIAAKITRRLLVRVLGHRKVDEAVRRFIGAIGFYSVLAATVIAALGAVGIQTTSLVAIFASAGLAIGLALQGSLANFASGILILVMRPIRLNDVVRVGGHNGRVDDVGLFATTLVTLDNEKIIVPNSKVTGDSIINYTTLGQRRGGVDVGVAYGSDVAKVMEVLLKAAGGVEQTLDDPAAAVAFTGLGASSLDFRVFSWSAPADFLPMLSGLRTAIYDALNEAGIEIPFNQIVVHNES